MRTIALAAGLVLVGTIAASAAPHHGSRRPNPAVDATQVAAPRTTGSIQTAPVQNLELFGDRANWGRRGPGLPSPINPLGYTGE
ncbi:hypothetical protein MKK75_16900 [Methylobacterium sp. J-030]|uniref:hypothetical protein n=1 Tax=Methylobacterium sp. J-030 TaxID=2836627 RepID=UPI001FBA2D1A|nr:hypothetical protein [Methylobacterium sp. J-030]MCJ2070458.1 hypothetical protein [Methylobacterium sp. J-030]